MLTIFLAQPLGMGTELKFMKMLKPYLPLAAFIIAVCLSCNSSEEEQPDLPDETTDEPIMDADAEVKKLAGDFGFTEGPAADSEGNVYFTDQPNDEILTWSVDNTLSVFDSNSGRSNGLFFDNEGRLLAAADSANQLRRYSIQDTTFQVLLDDYEDKRFNGPNDIWVDEKGGIYFTDPYYQRDWWERQQGELVNQDVYYLAPGADEARVVASGLQQPNGIIGSLEDDILYVADIGAGNTFRYSIQEDGNLTGKKIFVNQGSDGMTIDERGNIYLTGNGVHVFSPIGEAVTHIPINENWTANVSFGGREHKTLFITASEGLYSVDMNVRGNMRY